MELVLFNANWILFWTIFFFFSSFIFLANEKEVIFLCIKNHLDQSSNILLNHLCGNIDYVLNSLYIRHFMSYNDGFVDTHCDIQQCCSNLNMSKKSSLVCYQNAIYD